MQKKYAVYTALFGEYDDLVELSFDSQHCNFICFTDNRQLKSDRWIIKSVDCQATPTMMNRNYKFFPHKYLCEYQASLYVDANIVIKKDPVDLFERYLKDCDFLALKHYSRNCLYDEGLAVIKSGKARFEDVIAQLSKYTEEGYPDDYAITENRILLRNHNNQDVVNLMNLWWTELNNYTHRDQLSLGYVAWKSKYTIGIINENPLICNNYFDIVEHKGAKTGLLLKWMNRFIRMIRLIYFYPKYRFKL